jgi:hypothetical protein
LFTRVSRLVECSSGISPASLSRRRRYLNGPFGHRKWPKGLLASRPPSHTWRVRRSPETGKPVVVPNHIDHMGYVEGYEPSESKSRTDPHVGREM